MISRYIYHDLIWIDLENPTEEESSHIFEEFKITDIGKNFLNENIISTSLILPSIEYIGGQKIDFYISKNFVITVHQNSISKLKEFSKFFELNTKNEGAKMPQNGGYLFVQIMQEFFKDVHLINEIFKKNNNDLIIQRKIITKYKIISLFLLLMLIIGLILFIYLQ